LKTLLTILFVSTFVVKIFAQTETNEIMWPLQKGNAYQYFGSLSSQDGIRYRMDSMVVVRDSLINGMNYFSFSNSGDFFRYDVDSNKAYLKYDDSEYVYCDFNFPSDPDSIFYQIVPISHHFRAVFYSNDTVSIFEQNRKTTSWHTRYSFDYSSETFADGLGIIRKRSGHSGPGPDFERSSYLINAILYDSLNNFVYFTNHHKPEIYFQPFTTLYDEEYISFTAEVDHDYNRLNSFLGILSDGIIYIDSVFIELYYQKNQINTPIQKFYAAKTPGTYLYTFNIPIDTSLIKNGYKILYKIAAMDKAFFPEYSFSPDTGYYIAEYNPSVNVNDKNSSLSFAITQNYPNPFNPSTIIDYSIPKLAHVSIKVYNELGQKVVDLVDEEKSVGNYTIEFNAANLPSGIYFYQLITADFLETKKMILLK
jgi:hypothetical protein